MKRLLIWAMANVLCAVSALAATYPVELNVQLIPPYGNCLADYTATGGAERLIVNALQRDLNHATYDVAVRLTVRQGAHIVMRTSTSSVQPYRLPCGVMTRLSGLSQLFDPRNLEAGTEYADNGFCLPEGAYTLEFQAFDARNRSLPLSEPRHVTAFLGKTPPPRLTLPADGGCVDENSTVITFSWMEAIATPPSPDKRYTLEIFEVPEGYDNSVKDALLTGIQPIYSQTLTGSQTLCSVANRTGLFIKGRTYLWRVRASSVSADENMLYARYENGGFSKVSAFTFKHCVASSFSQMNIAADKPRKTDKKNAPTLLRIDTVTGPYAVWKPEPDKFPLGYVVEYNAEGSEAEWSHVYAHASDSSASLTGVGQDLTYVVHVIGLRGMDGKSGDTVFSANSNTLSFRLKSPDDLDCNARRSEITNLNEKEISQLPMLITANGDKVILLRYERIWDAYDAIAFPSVLSKSGNLIGVNVRASVSINTDNQMIDGVIWSNSDNENPTRINMNGTLNESYAGTGFARQKSIGDSHELHKGQDGETHIYLYKTEKTQKGWEYQEEEHSLRVESIDGVDPNCLPQESSIDDNVGVATFSPDEKSPLPFDGNRQPFTSMSIADYYTSYGTANRYDVPWVALPEKGRGRIHATFEVGDNTLGAESIRFVCQTDKEQIELPFERNGNEFTVEIFGGEAGSSLDVFAVADLPDDECRTLTLGRARIASLRKESFILHIVPVLGTTVDKNAIEEKLKEIYEPLGKTFEVDVEKDLYRDDVPDFEIFKDGLAVEGSGFMSRETEEMTKLKLMYESSRGFKYNRNLEQKHAYVFVLPKAETEGVMGDMPRCKPAGFVFTEGNDDIPSTIAHELGHGFFALEHTFEFAGAYQGATCSINGRENLMDYCHPLGNFLAVWQWNLLDSHKNYIFNIFEDDEDALLKVSVPVLKINYFPSFSSIIGSVFNMSDEFQKSYDEDPLVKIYKKVDRDKENQYSINFDDNGDLAIFKDAVNSGKYSKDNIRDRAKVLLTGMLLSAAAKNSFLNFGEARSECEGDTVKIAKQEILDSIYVMAKKDRNKTLIATKDELASIKCGVYKKVGETASIATLMHEFGHLLKDASSKGKKKDLKTTAEDYRKDYGYRCPTILNNVLKDLKEYMSGFDYETYMSGRKIGFDREALETIYSYVGEDQEKNKNNDTIFHEFKDDLSQTTIDNIKSIDIEKHCKKGTVNYLISTKEWEAIKNDMDSSKMKKAVDKLVEAMQDRIVWHEYPDSTTSFEKGYYSSVLWKEYFQYMIDRIPTEIPKNAGSDFKLWSEMSYLRTYVGAYNQAFSYDAAIMIDNYFRRMLNVCGIKQVGKPFGYRTQKGHLGIPEDDGDNASFVAKYVFNTDKYSSDSISKDCEKFKNFDDAENCILELLHSAPNMPNGKISVRNIKGLVNAWLSKEKEKKGTK